MSRRRCYPSLLLVVSTVYTCLAAPAAFADGKKYAFLVGINTYEHSKVLPQLQYAENDAIEVGQLLKKHGFEIVLLTDTSAKESKNDKLKPTKANIEKLLEQQLAKCREGDVLLLGFSGHGMFFDEESYFCAQDSAPSLEKKGLDTLIAVKDLYKKIGQCPAAKIMLIDACRNDPTDSMGLTDKTTPSPPKNALALFSCSIGEVSWELEDFHHGVFFNYVIEGLGGKARDDEGNITWSSLEVFVRKEVTREAPKRIKVGGAKKTEQRPTRVGEESGEPLVIIRGSGSNLGNESRASLDVILASIDRATATKNNVPQALQPQIVYVVPGGGGEALGLKKDDVVLRINGHDTPTSLDMTTALRQCTLGSDLEVQVMRKGKKTTLTGKYETTFASTEAFRRITDEAKKDPVAQHALATWYAIGFGTRKNDIEAISWYRKAADKGVVVSQRELGRCYLNGYYGLKKDESEALVWYNKAADAGDAEAFRNLGWMNEYGLGVTKDIKEAKRLYTKAADQGNTMALYDLGLMYANGRFGDPDYKEAVSWFRKAADQGLSDAENWLGVLHQRGQGVDKDEAKAVEWYRKAAEKDNMVAESNLGWMYAEGHGITKDEKEAVAWYRKSAAHGNALGIFNLGFMYELGRGIDKSIEEAETLYRRASDKGNSQAQYRLGLFYREGQIGGKVDEAAALRYFRKAADQNLALAENAVGEMLQAGKGDKADPVAAAGWFEKAAKQGLAQAEWNLAVCYEKGTGVKQDSKVALDWYKKAAALGNDQAKAAASRLEKSISTRSTDGPSGGGSTPRPGPGPLSGPLSGPGGR